MEAGTFNHGSQGQFFTVVVNGQEFQFDHEVVTGGEIMDLAGIPRDVGLIQILEDGTQIQVAIDDEIELKPGRRFKRAPRFIRG